MLAMLPHYLCCTRIATRERTATEGTVKEMKGIVDEAAHAAKFKQNPCDNDEDKDVKRNLLPMMGRSSNIESNATKHIQK